MGDAGDDTVRDQVATVDLRTRTDEPVPPAVDPHADRFEAIGELGRGGMGRVEDAFDRVLGRQVAIKRMLSDSSIDMARFEREARITARLEHPGIVPVHDVGRSADGTPYYVMRRVDGRPLSDAVEGRSLVERLALVPNVLAACEALAYAHARDIVHRDIKPTNILVGPFGETLVIDWGLARETGEARVAGPAIPASDPQLTRAGTIAGTPGFMAPEQARGEAVDARADVFALGATLFHVLAGRAPYASSEGATEMIAAVGNDRPPEWRLIPIGVPADLRAILVKSMAADPAERYPDAGALATDLRRFVTGKLVGARHYSRLDQVRRFMRRNRAAVAVAGLSLLVLAVGAALSVRRIVAERDAADVARALAETRQHETARTADRLLVERAHEVAERDPTAAIVLLRQLPPESELWPQAAAIAQLAWLRGIPFGFTSPVNARLALSEDGAHLVTAELRGGAMTIYDLVSRDARVLAQIPSFDELVWSDAQHVVVSIAEPPHLVSIETTTGQTRERPMPLRTTAIKVDRGGHLWIELVTALNDRRLYELAAFDAELVERAAHVRGWDLGAVVSGDHGALTLVTAAGTATVGRDELRESSNIDGLAETRGPRLDVTCEGDQVAISDRQVITRWGPRDGKLSELGRWTTSAGSVTISGKSLVAATVGKVLRLDPPDHQATLLGGHEVEKARDRARFAVPQEDGSITIFDGGESWTIGPRPAHYSRIRIGNDGRFVVAQTDHGQLLVFDLDRFGPRSFKLAPSETAFTMVPGFVWTDTSSAVRRHDLTTGEVRVLASPLDGRFIMGGFALGGGAALVSTQMMSGDPMLFTLVAIDGTTGAELARANDVVAWVTDDAQLTFLQGRKLVEWTASPGLATRELVELPRAPRVFNRSGSRLVFELPGEPLHELDLVSQARRDIPMPVTDAIDELMNDGDRIWCGIGSAVWQLESGKPPRRFALPQPVTNMLMTNVGPVIATSDALVTLADPPQLSPAARTQSMVSSPTERFVAWIGVKRQVELLDVPSGIGFPLGDQDASGLMVAGHELVVRTQDGLSVWTMAAPKDPIELTRWLATVTNVQTLSNSEVQIWPGPRR